MSGIGASWAICARRDTVPAVPSWRTNDAAPDPRPSLSPIVSRIVATASWPSSWFFGEKTSIDGGTIQTRSRSMLFQMKRRRENTYASAGST